MNGILKLMERERLTGEMPDWCAGGNGLEQGFRWCFDPGTITLGTILTGIGTVASVVGAVTQGQAGKSDARSQAIVLQQQADRDREKAAADEEDFRRNQSRVLAARRAAMGASGVEQGAGSPLLVSEDFARETELNALRIRSGGELRATRAEQQAQLQRRKGKAAGRAGFIRGGALLLSGAGKVFA